MGHPRRRIMQVAAAALVVLSVAQAAGSSAAPPRHEQGPSHLRGTVVAVESNGFTVQNAHERTVRVIVTPSTSYFKISPAALADADPGTVVRAAGERSESGAIAAKHVSILDEEQAAPGLRPNPTAPHADDRDHVTGRVLTNDGSTLTVLTPAGKPVTITTTAATEVTRVSAATFADVKPGTRVTVIGERSRHAKAYQADRVTIGLPAESAAQA